MCSWVESVEWVTDVASMAVAMFCTAWSTWLAGRKGIAVKSFSAGPGLGVPLCAYNQKRRYINLCKK